MPSKQDVKLHRSRPYSRSPEPCSREHKLNDLHKRTQSRPAESKSTFRHKSVSREKINDKISSKHRSKTKKKNIGSFNDDSSNSDNNNEQLKLLQKLEAERLKLKENKINLAKLLKANETPEEKRARRLRKKQNKEKKRCERMGRDNKNQCYTNQDNPFGDYALTNTFVWTKKLAKEGFKKVSMYELEALNRQKQLENRIELENLKQQRLERENERAAREAETSTAENTCKTAQFHSWAHEEDAFQLQQTRLRSIIRIRDGRAKPIDLLARYVSSEECVDAVEMHEPYTYLNGLQMQDLEHLLEDIKVYKDLENNTNLSYWEDIQTITLVELNNLYCLATTNTRRDGVHQAVANDVTEIFKGKNAAQLQVLQTQIEQKVIGRGDGVDVGYWETLLSQLKAHIARARLRDRHQSNLRRKLQLLKQQQDVQPLASGASKNDDKPRIPEAESQPSEEQLEAITAAAIDGGEEAEAACVALYRSGCYSPALLTPAALEPVSLLIEPADDDQRLAYLRSHLHAANAQAQHLQSTTKEGNPETSEEALKRAAARSMDPSADETPFSLEHALPDQPCLWDDRYRPSKPRYFNRVHTGFEWNKYNQTHYDIENPPPKVVQGYKFNIFYPDLIDKNMTPKFSLKPCPENSEFAVLRFHAGPPYEDVAFKIVNQEWEYSYKRGFRCHFQNNIFQLWFHFKRYRYRR